MDLFGLDPTNQISGAFARAVNQQVDSGLRTTLNKYNSSISSGLTNFVSGGGQRILSSVGINANAIPGLYGINSAIVNVGQAAASNLLSNITGGVLNNSNIGTFTNLNFLNSSSSPIANSIRGLSNLVGLNLNNSGQGQIPIVNSMFGNSSLAGGMTSADVKSEKMYAMDLDKLITKYKFMFIVQFVMAANYEGMKTNKMSFLVREFDRPKFTIEHDDVNFYNFRTKIPKKITYEPVSMKFHDDGDSETLKFFMGYMKAMSPMLNIPTQITPTTDSMKSGSMSFNKNATVDGTTVKQYSASLGLLQDDIDSVIDKIQLFHVYNNGGNVDEYTFVKPKITTMELDSLNMSENNVSEVAVTFAYDTVYTEIGKDFASSGAPSAISVANFAKELTYNPHTKKQIESKQSQAADDSSAGDEESSIGGGMSAPPQMNGISSLGAGFPSGLGSAIPTGVDNNMLERLGLPPTPIIPDRLSQITSGISPMQSTQQMLNVANLSNSLPVVNSILGGAQQPTGMSPTSIVNQELPTIPTNLALSPQLESLKTQLQSNDLKIAGLTNSIGDNQQLLQQAIAQSGGTPDRYVTDLTSAIANNTRQLDGTNMNQQALLTTFNQARLA